MFAPPPRAEEKAGLHSLSLSTGRARSAFKNQGKRMSQDLIALPHESVAAQRAARSSHASFLSHAKLIGALTLVSRILGLGREIIAGHYLGTGLIASAFSVAFSIPNLFRKLFG